MKKTNEIIKVQQIPKTLLSNTFDYYNQCFNEDNVAGTLTTNSNFTGCGVQWVIRRTKLPMREVLNE